MANFKYTALSVSGETVKGVVEAAEQFEAVAKIKQNCPIIVEIEEVGAVANAKVNMKKIDAKTLALMCNRFSMLLAVGLPIVKSVEMLATQIEDKYLSYTLKDIAKDVAMGKSLYSSFKSRKGVFPVTFLESVRSGEESGDLVNAFDRLSKYYDKTSKIKQKVISALTYPAFTIVVAIVVLVIIMVYGVPSFSRSFAQSGAEMPFITVAVIAVSNFFVHYGIFVLAIIVGIVIGLRLYSRTDKGAETFSAIILGLPIVGKIIQLSSASQFAHTMAMLLSSGMPIINCIDIAGKSVSNYIIRRDILKSAVDVEEGKSMGSCLAQSKYLPPMLIEMVSMGEQTGTMEKTLSAVGDFYDNEVDVHTTRALSVLEPAIICLLAVMVVIILLSVYLPMFSMYG
ncbi:MAG: type II secretion system F family protein [Lachnospiraceae bacterium]|nr:type II secretion system F family protein [Lachnospiraceae bacterium]